mmetsp:Transcript_25046/g.42331  ORF Transcript_25046/g.42331 Transcript_25046/m.42331 type:complete len:1263 (-) Transcript_25046:300-4088(-)
MIEHEDLDSTAEVDVNDFSSRYAELSHRVASLIVDAQEAQAFDKFAEMVGIPLKTLSGIMNKSIDDAKITLQPVLRDLMCDDTLWIEVKGSMKKGTQTPFSDIDIVVHTIQPVSEAAKLHLIAGMREKPDIFGQDSFIKLKNIAISCVHPSFGEIDLVFANTVEFGQLTGLSQLDKRYHDNQVAQIAARILKYSVSFAAVSNASQNAGKIIPSFLLETVVIQAQRLFQPSPCTALALFLDTLQLLCDVSVEELLKLATSTWLSVESLNDSEGNTTSSGFQGFRLSQDIIVSLCQHARQLLHLFCASRIFTPPPASVNENDEVVRRAFLIGRGLTVVEEMELWIRQIPLMMERDFYMPIGHIPGWMIAPSDVKVLVRDPSCIHTLHSVESGYYEDTNSTARSIESSEKLKKLQVVTSGLFLASEYGKYCNKVNAEELSRENANALYNNGDFQSARKMYTELLNQSTLSRKDRARLLSNRSAVFEKLNRFREAECDGIEVIREFPRWVKGYVRVIKARLGRHNGKGVLDIIKSSVCHLSSDHLALLEREYAPLAEDMLATAHTQRIIPSNLPCWEKVKYKASVLIVDSTGGMETIACLAEAIIASSSTNEPTSIIVMEGEYCIQGGISIGGYTNGNSLQIIGNGEVTVKNHDSDPRDFAKAIICAFGPGSHIIVEGLTLKTASGIHCMMAMVGATIDGINCKLFSELGICCAARAGGTCTLLKCETYGPGSGVLICGEHSSGRIVDTNVFNSMKIGVEIREGGSCTLSNCTFRNCTAQGVSLAAGGVKASLEDCSFSHCGNSFMHSSVFAECGWMNLIRCSVCESAHDGIVVQDKDGTAKLSLSACTISRNVNIGICVYGGLASVINCHIEDNTIGGIFFKHNHSSSGTIITRLREFSRLEECYFSGNQRDVGIFLDVDKRNFNGRKLNIVKFSNNSSRSEGALFVSQSSPSLCLKSSLQSVHPIYTYYINLSSGELWTCSAKHSRPKQYERRNQEFFSPDGLPPSTFDKKSLLRAQKFALEDIVAQRHPPEYRSDYGNAKCRKPVSCSKNLRECGILDLPKLIGKRAKGRILFGELCADPCFNHGLATVLEDRKGYAVKLLLHVPAVHFFHWQECFPNGMSLAIREPLLKRATDGTIAVCVDNESDIEYVSKACEWSGCRRVSVRLKLPTIEEVTEMEQNISNLKENISNACRSYYHPKGEPEYSDAQYEEMKNKLEKAREDLAEAKGCQGRANSDITLRSCSKCKQVLYCSKECQKKRLEGT